MWRCTIRKKNHWKLIRLDMCIYLLIEWFIDLYLFKYIHYTIIHLFRWVYSPYQYLLYSSIKIQLVLLSNHQLLGLLRIPQACRHCCGALQTWPSALIGGAERTHFCRALPGWFHGLHPREHSATGGIFRYVPSFFLGWLVMVGWLTKVLDEVWNHQFRNPWPFRFHPSISHYWVDAKWHSYLERHKPWFTYHDAIGLLCVEDQNHTNVAGTVAILSFFAKFWDGFRLRIHQEETRSPRAAQIVSCEAFLHPAVGYTVDGSPCFGIKHRWLAVHKIPHVYIGGSAVPSLSLRPCDVASVAKWPLGLMNICSGIAPLAFVHLFVLAKTSMQLWEISLSITSSTN